MMELFDEDVSKSLRIRVCDIRETPSVSSREWDTYLSLLSEEEKHNILRYRIDDDRRRALVSVMLQKSTVRSFLNATCDSSFSINRTPEKKPYPVSKNNDFGTWNYNLSHHGHYVGIASHTKYLVGCDIVDLSTRTRMAKSCSVYLENFKNQLTQYEFNLILSQQNELMRYNMFFIIWSLKEAYVKAIGEGLGFDLHSVYFKVDYGYGHEEETKTEDEAIAGASGYGGFESELIYGTAVAVVLGIERRDWAFRFQSIDTHHIITVALGPLQESIPSYRKARWGRQPGSAITDLACAERELSLWSADTAPLSCDNMAFASLMSIKNAQSIGKLFSEIPMSPPFLELNNRGDEHFVVFSSEEERVAASNANTPALQNGHFAQSPHQVELKSDIKNNLKGDNDDDDNDAYSSEIQEQPWRSCSYSDSDRNPADQEWVRPESPSAPTLSTISMPEFNNTTLNKSSDTYVSIASLDIHSPASWRREHEYSVPDTSNSFGNFHPPRGIIGVSTGLDQHPIVRPKAPLSPYTQMNVEQAQERRVAEPESSTPDHSQSPGKPGLTEKLEKVTTSHCICM